MDAPLRIASCWLLIALRAGRARLPRAAGPAHRAGQHARASSSPGDYVESGRCPAASRACSATAATPARRRCSRELRKAERDDRITGVRDARSAISRSAGRKAQELRDAIAALRAKGRHPIAYLEVEALRREPRVLRRERGRRGLRSRPATRTPFVGLAAEYLFLGGLLGEARRRRRGRAHRRVQERRRDARGHAR